MSQIVAPDTNGVRSDEFAVITCHWNPANWKSLRRNYQRFLHEMAWWGIPTFSVEVAYPGQEWASDKSWLKLRGNESNILWQKERLLNLLVEKLPANFTKIAWIDADILFVDPDWVQHACTALDAYPVVQLWNKWHCAGADGSIAEVLPSVGHKAESYVKNQHCSPGGAWAAVREVFPLYDRHIVGSGDAMCLEGWLGSKRSRCMHQFTPAMREDFYNWAAAAHKKVAGYVTTLQGDAIHLYHGSRKNRQYIDRWKPVIAADFNPISHVAVDGQGLLSWTTAAPKELIAFVRDYFASRLEDDVTRPYEN